MLRDLRVLRDCETPLTSRLNVDNGASEPGRNCVLEQGTL